MRWLTIIFVLIIVILLIFIGGVFLFGLDDESQENSENMGDEDGLNDLNKEEIVNNETEEIVNQEIPTNFRCVELGCDEDTIYVGSVNSDKYYTCECHYADRILEENIICFINDEEAIEAGYVKIEDC